MQVIYLGLTFLPKVIFSVYERLRDLLGSQKKTEGFFLVAKKALRDFVGMMKKVVISLGRQILKLEFFWI